jgi:UPF0716 protein FxsA
MPIFLLFIVFPIAEIMVFAEVIDSIGFLATFFLAILSAVAGGAIVQQQGFENLLKFQKSSDQGVFPADEMFDGLCLLVAGIAFILPGFISDAIAFALLLPFFRKFLKGVLQKRFSVGGQASATFSQGGRVYDPNAIDAEFERVEDTDKPRHITKD